MAGQYAAIQNVWGDIKPSFLTSMPVGDDILLKLEDGGVLEGSERDAILALPVARRKEARESLLEILKEKGEKGYMKFVQILETEKPDLDLHAKFRTYESKHRIQRSGGKFKYIKVSGLIKDSLLDDSMYETFKIGIFFRHSDKRSPECPH